MESCTDAIHTSKPFELDGVEVTLVDTPGFDDTNKSDAEILAIVCDYLASECVSTDIECIEHIIETVALDISRGANFMG